MSCSYRKIALYRKYAWIAVLIALLILTHQVFMWNRIDWDQIMHHEVIALILISFAIGVIIMLPRKLRGPPKRI